MSDRTGEVAQNFTEFDRNQAKFRNHWRKADDVPVNLIPRRVAELVYESRMTQAQIAEHVGISRRSVCRWLHRPAFAAMIEEMREAGQAEMLSRAKGRYRELLIAYFGA